MKVFTNALFKNSKVVLHHGNTVFPITPELGEFCIVDGILYIYTTIDSTNTWRPLTKKIQHYKHIQDIPGFTWTVAHNLNSQDLIIVVYDSENAVNFPSNITFTDDNNITLTFGEPIGGKALIFAMNDNYALVESDRSRKITLSTTDPSGGSDGDIWFKYTA